MLHVNLRTVINWETGATTIPYAAYKLLRVLSGYELPGEPLMGVKMYERLFIRFFLSYLIKNSCKACNIIFILILTIAIKNLTRCAAGLH
jgi:hypothetical protein